MGFLYSNNRCDFDRGTEQEHWPLEVKRLKSEKLALSGIRSFYLRDYSKNGYDKGHMGFYEAKNIMVQQELSLLICKHFTRSLKLFTW